MKFVKICKYKFDVYTRNGGGLISADDVSIVSCVVNEIKWSSKNCAWVWIWYVTLTPKHCSPSHPIFGSNSKVTTKMKQQYIRSILSYDEYLEFDATQIHTKKRAAQCASSIEVEVMVYRSSRFLRLLSSSICYFSTIVVFLFLDHSPVCHEARCPLF